MEKQLVYVRMKRKRTLPVYSKVKVGDIADLSGKDAHLTKEAKGLFIYEITKSDYEYAVIDSLHLIALLDKYYSNVEWQLIGASETVLQIQQPQKKWLNIKFVVAWLILFIGTAMTIINFHYDVEMSTVHQKLHFLFTGNKNEHPYLLQIPYSFGLGIGMVLFLNHWFKKRFNEEPSPLEIELFSYEQQVDQYIAYHENKLNDKNNT